MRKFILITLLCALALALATFACDDGNGTETHTHEWGAWQSNAEQHWKECSCGEKTDIGNHTGNPCTVCGYETAHEPQPKTITQADGLAFDGKVTIKTSDLYLNADWNAVVANVITALNAAYTSATGPSQSRFASVFGNTPDHFGNGGNGVEIILVNNFANNYEVRTGEMRTLYLKTGSIATANYGNAVQYMASNAPGVG